MTRGIMGAAVGFLFLSSPPFVYYYYVLFYYYYCFVFVTIFNSYYITWMRSVIAIYSNKRINGYELRPRDLH